MDGIIEFSVRASDKFLDRAKDVADVVVIVAGHLRAFVALTSGYRCIVC